MKKIAVFCATPLSYGGGYESFVERFVRAADRAGHTIDVVEAPLRLFRNAVSLIGRRERFANATSDRTHAARWISRLQAADVIYCKLEVLDLLLLRPIVNMQRVVAGMHTPLKYPIGYASPLRRLAYAEWPLRSLVGSASLHLLHRTQVEGAERLRRPYIIVSNGVRRPQSTRRPFASDALRALFVGRFASEKGVERLPAVLRNPSIHSLTICGDGPLRPFVEELAKRDDRVELMGWCSTTQLESIFVESDVLVMPSRWESMPLVALEALRAGVPVLAQHLPITDALATETLGLVPVDFESDASLTVGLQAVASLGIQSDTISQMADRLYDDQTQYELLLNALLNHS